LAGAIGALGPVWIPFAGAVLRGGATGTGWLGPVWIVVVELFAVPVEGLVLIPGATGAGAPGPVWMVEGELVEVAGAACRALMPMTTAQEKRVIRFIL
jgi:hypothetical protein